MKCKKGYSFQEVALIFILLSLFATIAVASYNWLYEDTESRVLNLKADEIERSIRSLANTELVAPNTISLENIISELSEPDIIITEKPNGVEIVYSNSKVCLILGDEVNEKGLITNGSC